MSREGGARLKMVLESVLSWPALLVLVTVLCYLLDLPGAAYRYHRRLKLLRAIPDAVPRPVWRSLYWLLGHIPVVYKQDEELIWRGIEVVNDPDRREFSLAIMWLGPTLPMIHISHPKLVKQLLKEPKSRLVYNMLIPWLGKGVLISEGQRWFRSRRLLTPAFHFEILKGYVPVYNDRLSILLQKWTESAANNESVLLFDSLSAMSLDVILLDVILRCAFSFDGNCQSGKEKHPYARACCELVLIAL